MVNMFLIPYDSLCLLAKMSLDTPWQNNPTPTTSINMLPYEMLKGILILLPIDSQLVSIALASKTVFAPTIFHNIHFARLHFKHRLTISAYSFWYFLHKMRHRVSRVESNPNPAFMDFHVCHEYPFIVPKSREWSNLPMNYKSALYGEILMHPEWDGIIPFKMRAAVLKTMNEVGWNDMCESDHDIMRPVYWEMPEREAVVVMQKLLESRVGGFTADCQSNRPLRWAARNGHVDVVQLLLRVSDDVDPTMAGPVLVLDEDSINPIINCRNALNSLDIACAYGRYQIAEILLQDSRVTKNTCDRAYHFGSLKIDSSPFGRNYAHVIRVLLEDGRADPSFPRRHHFYADAVEFLLKDGRLSIADDVRGAGLNAVETGNVTVLKHLLELNHGKPFPSDIVVTTAKHRQVHIMLHLLSYPECDPSVQRNAAIRNASAYGDSAIVRLLLSDSRVDPSMPGLDPSLPNGSREPVNFQNFRDTALHLAIRGRHVNVVQLLLADKRTDILSDTEKYPDTFDEDVNLNWAEHFTDEAAMQRELPKRVLTKEESLFHRAQCKKLPAEVDNIKLAIEMGNVEILMLLQRVNGL